MPVFDLDLAFVFASALALGAALVLGLLSKAAARLR